MLYFLSLVKRASKRVLASGLAFSGGLMSYVLFIEIFMKSVSSFEEGGLDKKLAYSYATLSFFGGVIILFVSYHFYSNRMI